MAYMYRRVRNYWFGTLKTAATISATTLSCDDFAPLQTNYSTDSYLPLVLHDPATKLFEVVWLTAHASAATTATVERGKESSTARAWPAGTQILCAPTVRDGTSPMARASLPSDPFVGERHTLDDEGFAVQGTFASGWQADVGVAVPAEYGKRQDGTAVPSFGVIIMRGGKVSASTDALGQVQVTYASPFPTQTLHVAPGWVSGGGVAPFNNIGVVDGSHTAAGFKVYLYRADTSASAGAGVPLVMSYLATGY
jgi:hypothetical protein